MKQLLRFLLLALWLAAPVTAQEDDESGGMLSDFLENTLSTNERNIKLHGLTGALSSQAEIEELTVSDPDGIWLRITKAQLDWNRLALLRGRFSVNMLAAETIEVLRKPLPAPVDPELPTPEAAPFQVPELPVSIEIGHLKAGKISLGPDVLGKSADMSLDGAVSIVEGALNTTMALTRLDRPNDRIELVAKFSNETRQLTLDLDAAEDQGGLMSALTKIPGSPALHLKVHGDGPLTDFTADLALKTEGVDRLAGTVKLRGVKVPDNDRAAIAFDADIGGDVTPMLPKDYRAFFGDDLQLTVSGQSDPDGRLTLPTLSLNAQALDLTGALSLAPGGIVERADLEGRIVPPSGQDVLLPLAERTTLGRATFTLRQDREIGPDWSLRLLADRLERSDMSLETAALEIIGTLDQSQGLALAGTVQGRLGGLHFTDPALQSATGPFVRLTGAFATDGTGALSFSELSLEGQDYSAEIDGTLDGFDSGFAMDGTAHVRASNLSRFSGLAKRDLGGTATLALRGTGSPLGGAFDFDLDMQAQDLSAGIKQVDSLLVGNSALHLSAARGEQGLTIRDFTLDTAGTSARAKGTLSSRDSALTFNAALKDVAKVYPDITGPLTLKGDLSQVGTVWSGDITLNGPHNSFADLSGKWNPAGTADIDFDAAFADIGRFVPQLTGNMTAKGNAKQIDGIWHTKATVKGANSSFAKLDGTLDPKGNADFAFDAAFDQMERFMPEFAGTLTAKGRASRQDAVWTIDADATGPGDIKARVDGTFDETTTRADISSSGQVRLDTASLFMEPNQIQGLAKFDLRLNGKPGLDALSGIITTSGTTLALPSVAQSFENIAAQVQITNARAAVSASGNLRAGGGFKVNGPVSLKPPFDGQLVLDLLNLTITDKVSFESSANGRIAMNGPLVGGASISGNVTFGKTDINLNAVSGGVGAAPIPPITHVGETAAQRTTRDQAGLIKKADSDGAGPLYHLDIDLLAPKKVFATGFGLNAELGGAINIAGTSRNVVPSGEIELIRGTLDLIGRRLKLTKGQVTLQGDLSPYVDFQSSTTTSDGQATFELAGPLDAPKVSVYADPERPAEEALAMLLFGNRFSELSPFVIAQMAASLASMAGAGGNAKNDAKNKAGVDMLDIGADESGAGRVGAGAYLGENIYTDFSVNTRGETELNLNLDITDSLTAKGTVEGSGDSKLGIFFERDY